MTGGTDGGERLDAQSAGGAAPPSRQTVLVIDDDPGYSRLVADILEMTGLGALLARSGKEGLAAARLHRPDLILLDVQMPGIDGYETCRRLKAEGATSDIPVLFMSGQADVEDKVTGFDAGGLDYIPKPFQTRELLARIRTHLKLQDQSRLLLVQATELQKARDALEERVVERTAALKQSQAKLMARVQELSALNAVAHIIANTSDLGDMMQRVLETTLSLAFLKVQNKGAVFLRDESDAARLNRVAFLGISQCLVEAEAQIAVGHCLCGACVEAGKSIVTTGSGPAEHPFQYPGILEHGHIVIPIKSRDAVLGVITLYLEPGLRPSDADVRVLEAIASQLGLAVENRRLFQILSSGKREWEETFDAIADLVTINGLDHRVLRLNRAAARVFGGHEKSIGRQFCDLLGDAAFAEQCRTASDLSALPKTATIGGRQYDTSVYPMQHDGALRGSVFVAKDVTERNLAEQSLREQRAFTDNLLQSTSVATFVVNARHEVIFWNKACEELTGFPAAAMIGTTGQWRPFYPQQRPVLADIVLDAETREIDTLYAKVSKSVLTAEGLQAEGWYRNLNGKDRYIVFDAAPIRDIDGTVIAAIETLQDITSRKRAEDEIVESERRYRQFFENADDLIQTVALDGRLLHANPAWFKTLGYTPEDLQRLRISDILDPSCLSKCMALFDKVVSGHAVEYFETTLVDRDGRRVDAEGSVSAVEVDGRVVSVHGILHNVTERKRLAEMTSEQMSIAELERDIGAILNSGGSIGAILQSCAAVMVKHLGAAFARIWTVDDARAELVLQASAGMYTHTDGPHGRLPIGLNAKIPLIAATRKPSLTNAVVGDPAITEQAWAIREGIVSFAGYPLVVGDRVLGVLGMFARRPLSPLVLGALEFVAGNIALGIERSYAAESLVRYSAELTALNAASNTLMASANLQEMYQKICNIVVSVFDLKLSWLGLIEPDTFNIRPVAHAGEEDGFLSGIRVTWDDTPFGRGPSGTAIKTKTTSQAILDDSSVAPWRSEAQKRGYRAVLSVPLIHSRDECIGVLNFYSGQGGYFDADRVKLCQIFANQAAIAIENARLIEGLEETVHERTRKIKETNIALRRLNRELELRREEAETANRTKSDFLANMSHELRTPLNAIIGFSDLMVRGMAGPLAGEQPAYLGDILSSGQHLLSLINDILDLSKVEAGKMDFEPAEFDLPQLVGSSASLFREKALKHGIRLETQTAAGPARMHGDERKIKQVVFNLLSNAMKFTPDGGAVSIVTAAVRVDGVDCAEIAVSDTGIGMTPEEQGQLFQPFKQIGHHLTKQHEGTGLGLALCRKFVEMHGGDIAVASEPGRGSTFTVRLPLGGGT
jgi:PAS domain S-box-containing protein